MTRPSEPITGEADIWIEPSLAEHWLPQPGDGYTLRFEGGARGGKRLRSVVRDTRPGDGGLWMRLDIVGEYPDCQ